MFILNGKRFNPESLRGKRAPDGSLRSDYPTAQDLLDLGVTEVADPSPPEDYSEDTYFRNEIDEAPYVVFERKNAAAIKVATNSKLQAQISSLEQNSLMPRATREFMLTFMEVQAAAQGVTPEQLAAVNAGYRKVKEFDAMITSMRQQLHPVDEEMQAILDAQLL